MYVQYMYSITNIYIYTNTGIYVLYVYTLHNTNQYEVLWTTKNIQKYVQ